MRKVIKLAKPGQVRGFAIPGDVDADYADAAKLALDNPKHPVIVHEHPFTIGGEPKAQLDSRETVRKQVGAIVKTQMMVLNAREVDGVERYHVGYSVADAEELYRTVVVYYPNGRPKRGVGPTDPPPPPEDDPDAPRGSLLIADPPSSRSRMVASEDD